MTFVSTMENAVGYLISGLIGISLGLIGGGGSIITIPMLVYLFHIAPSTATTYSLFIVGTTSLVGGIRSAISRNVDFNSALLFSIPSTLAVYLTRHSLLPLIPTTIVETPFYTITKNIAIMIFFALIMVGASLRMIRDKSPETDVRSAGQNYFKVIVQGLVVGIVTGIVGAGGGFLIIPALVLFSGLPMKKAIGTSLLVIAVNSLVGFVGDIELLKEVNFSLLAVLSGIAVVGVFLGTYLSNFVKGKDLKSGFGWFSLLMAIYIMIREVVT